MTKTALIAKWRQEAHPGAQRFPLERSTLSRCAFELEQTQRAWNPLVRLLDRAITWMLTSPRAK